MRSDKFSTKREIINYLSHDKDKAGICLYYDDAKNMSYKYTGEGNAIVLGVPGSGKTSTFTLPTALDIIKNNESLICVDPKADIFEYTYNEAKKNHDVYVLNFRDIMKSDGVNLLSLPYELWTGDDNSKEKAVQLVNDIANSIFTIDKNPDPFWPESARLLFIGCCFMLFNNCSSKEEVSMPSLSRLIKSIESKEVGPKTLIQNAFEFMKVNSIERSELASYVNSPNETRMSTFAVCSAGLKPFTSSPGMERLLMSDDININELGDSDKPLALYIILPDESSCYSKIASILIGQIISHLISKAEENEDHKLRIKTHFLLEELGNIDPIPDFSHAVATCRSRNINIYAVLQSFSQMSMVYSDKAQAILDCFDITVAYRCSNQDTLKSLSDRCGIKREILHNTYITEPLCTPGHLGALTTRQCLVLLKGRYKYITMLPFASEINPTEKFLVKNLPVKERDNIDDNIFNLSTWVRDKREKKISDLLSSSLSNDRKNDDDLDSLHSELKKEIEEELSEMVSSCFLECKCIYSKVENMKRLLLKNGDYLFQTYYIDEIEDGKHITDKDKVTVNIIFKNKKLANEGYDILSNAGYECEKLYF